MSPLPASFCLLLLLLCTMSLSAMSFFMLREQEEYGYDICSGRGDGAKKQSKGANRQNKTEQGSKGPAFPDVGWLLAFLLHLLAQCFS